MQLRRSGPAEDLGRASARGANSNVPNVGGVAIDIEQVIGETHDRILAGIHEWRHRDGR